MGQNVKQVIVLRKDLHMRKGKMVAQGAHASLDAFLSLFTKTTGNGETSYTLHVKDESMLSYWMDGSYTKICLYVESEKELVELYERIRRGNPAIPVALIEDMGLTEFHGQITKTAVGIGPYRSDEIDRFTKDLKLL